MWRLFLYPLGGPVDVVLGTLGLRSEFLGGPPTEAFAWVTVVQIWANMGITMVIFLAGSADHPGRAHRGGPIDGASRRQSFWHVTWPLLTPSVNTNLILMHHRLAPGVAAVPGAHRLPAGDPGAGLRRVRPGVRPDVAAARPSNSFRQGYGAAASVVLFVLVFVIGMTAQYLLRRREERLLG